MKYTNNKYDLLKNSCNDFSNDFMQFLVGKEFPKEYEISNKVMSNPAFSKMVMPVINQCIRLLKSKSTPYHYIPATTAAVNTNPPTHTNTSAEVKSGQGVNEQKIAHLLHSLCWSPSNPSLEVTGRCPQDTVGWIFWLVDYSQSSRH